MKIDLVSTVLIVWRWIDLGEAGNLNDPCIVETTGENGVCTKNTDCPGQMELGERGKHITRCGLIDNKIAILCCPLLHVSGNVSVNPIKNRGGAAAPNEAIPGRSEKKCRDYTGERLMPFIIGGTDAKTGEFPFMASLLGRASQDDELELKCGGTLISERYVLTAAHCTSREPVTIEVIRLGSLDLRTPAKYVYQVDAVKVISHPDYQYPSKYNDIALVLAKEYIRFTDLISPACITAKTEGYLGKAVATGWGKTDVAGRSYSPILKKVDLNVYDNVACTAKYPVHARYYSEGIASTMLCAGQIGGGGDTCQGDSGGPLFVYDKEVPRRIYVVGITSFGKSCGHNLAVYTRVSKYINWIEDIVWPDV